MPDHLDSPIPSGAVRQPNPDTRFRELFEQAPVSLQILAADGRTVQVNQAWCALWQIHPGTPVGDYVVGGAYNVLTDPQLDAKGVLPYLRRAFAGESVDIPAIRYDTADLGEPGPSRWVTARAHPLKDAAGRVLEVMLMHEDITDRVQAEMALAERLARERRYSALLAKVADASRVLHAALSAQDIADALVALATDILGVGGAAVTLDAGPHGGPVRAGARADDHVPALAVPLIGRDGVRLGQVEVADKLAGGLAAEDEAILVQLAAIAAVGVENAHLLAALREQDRRKDEFLAMLAHELRNPLAPVSAAAQVLRRTPRAALGEDKLRQYSDIIARQVGHMSALLDDLLDVSRVTRGMIRLDAAPVAVHAVLTSAAEQAQPLVEAKGHLLSVVLDAPRARVHGDRARLVQVVSNLLTNAAKYTPPGGRIRLSAQVTDGQVRIAVADNGSGIETALLPHVFELFTQGARTLDRAQGGLGLGLALVKSMVGLHGGSVAAHSDGPGRGSVFTLALPLLDGLHESATAPDAAAHGVAGKARRALSVMIVDDNADSVLTLGALLQAVGHSVTTLTDPLAAPAAAAGSCPDVFVLDIGMPGMDGYELVRRLRADPATRGALCIALSGYGQPDDRQAAFDAGFDRHFAKPVDTRLLLALLDERAAHTP